MHWNILLRKSFSKPLPQQAVAGNTAGHENRSGLPKSAALEGPVEKHLYGGSLEAGNEIVDRLRQAFEEVLVMAAEAISSTSF